MADGTEQSACLWRRDKLTKTKNKQTTNNQRNKETNKQKPKNPTTTEKQQNNSS